MLGTVPAGPLQKPIKLKAAVSSLPSSLEIVRYFHADARPDLSGGSANGCALPAQPAFPGQPQRSLVNLADGPGVEGSPPGRRAGAVNASQGPAAVQQGL